MDFSERFSKTAPRAADFRKSLNAIGPVATLEGEGELHLQLVCARLAREFKVQCAAGRPQVASKLAAPSKGKDGSFGGPAVGGVSRATMGTLLSSVHSAISRGGLRDPQLRGTVALRLLPLLQAAVRTPTPRRRALGARGGRRDAR